MTLSPCIRSITTDPPAPEWGDLITRRLRKRGGDWLFGKPIDEWVASSRSEIGGGLSGVDYVIGTGHQAGFWHCGILAKYCAADAAAVAFSQCFSGEGGVLEIVVDQDVNDPFAVRALIRRNNLEAVSVRLAGVNGEKSGKRIPVEKRLPIAVDKLLPKFINEKIEPSSAREGLYAIAKAIGEAEGEAGGGAGVKNAAGQAARANYLLRARTGLVADVKREITFASELTTLSVWERLVALMRDDPRKCALCYNDAVIKFPDSGITLLQVDGDDIELPLWKIDEETGERHRAYSRDLESGETVLRPRALLMTGLVRLVLVDLFIHGTGGGNYDRVTEEWFYDWLGVSLSPFATVSADVHLDFGMGLIDEKAVSDARWRLHHLRYNLDRVVADGTKITARKRMLLRQMEDLPRKSAERYEAYLELQSLNEALRQQHEKVLNDARMEISNKERALASRTVIGDRTWPFPLHDRKTLQALREEITKLFSEAGVGVACCCGGAGLLGS